MRIKTARSNNLHYVGRGTRAPTVDDPYLLRGLAYCGLCESKLQMRAGTAPGSRYYYCHWSQPHAQRRSGGARTCSLPWIPAVAAEHTPMVILVHALLMPEEIVQGYATLVSGETYLEGLGVRLADVAREEKRLKDQEQSLLDKALSFGFSEDTVSAKHEELRSRLDWLAEQRLALERDLKRAEEKNQTVAWMRDSSLALFYYRKVLEKWWMESSTKSQQHRLLRALIDLDGGGKILVYPPPPGYIPDPILDLSLWGGRVECRFKFNPRRLIEALENLGVMGSGTDGAESDKHAGSGKVAE